jgi:hypothetical protein
LTPNIIDIESDSSEVVEITQEMMREISEFVANGGAITRYCLINGLNYGCLRNEIRVNSDFKQMLSTALADREEWFKEELIQLLKSITQINLKTFFDDNGHYKNIQDVPDSATLLLKKVKVKLQKNLEDPNAPPDEILELELYDKQKSIDQLGKHIQMFMERVQVDHTISLEDIVNESWKPPKL